jgi:MioC protein
MNHIEILVGTMTGNATYASQEIELCLADDDTQITVTPMDDLSPAYFDSPAANKTFLILTATYGQGEVPDNAKPLFDALTSQKPDLSHVRYGIFGLGDRTYADTFNFGGKKFDDLMQSLGAQRIGERGTHDAASGELAEDAALAWTTEWLTLL